MGSTSFNDSVPTRSDCTARFRKGRATLRPIQNAINTDMTRAPKPTNTDPASRRTSRETVALR